MATEPAGRGAAVPAESARTRVLHLAGSAETAFLADLSRLYAAGALAAAADGPYEHVVAWVEPGGGWRFPADLSREAVAAAPVVSRAKGLAVLASLEVDVALPQMFCRSGMTAYRSLLTDVLRVPTVGNTGDVMAIGAHKQRARAIVAAAGVAVPDGEVLRPGDVPTLAPPVVVKPVDADNSHGVTLVREPGEYDAALATAFEHAGPTQQVLVETYVELGREVRCGIVERRTDDGVELVCLPLEEYAVDPDTKPVRDAADKITRSDDDGTEGGGDLRLMAKDADHAWIVPLDDPAVPAVHELARRAHVALGCRDHSLVDVRIDPHGTPYFLEASLYCSFAPSSVVVMMAASAGVPLEALLADQVAAALARGA
ncbi:hypothetical protein [Nocardioides sp. CFH 31398]|uniref:D-alanine--D-alanine ligase family protein n=1 Tax=Nocardioides sp. CFH 31398 TaxID=2919579 RepID=UPI001F063C43|nr:hypothetical protein [Nocardioides sp. CFH 31398]MCH1865759.1 hypothetical protein [Nocardioides sp. CFH 31398]